MSARCGSSWFHRFLAALSHVRDGLTLGVEVHGLLVSLPEGLRVHPFEPRPKPDGSDMPENEPGSDGMSGYDTDMDIDMEMVMEKEMAMAMDVDMDMFWYVLI